jgi:hypothetical protein
MSDNHPHAGQHLWLGILICVHIVICCISLAYVADSKFYTTLEPAKFQIFFDPSRWYVAVAVAAAFTLVSPLFVFSGFSFGYLVGFYFYTMVLGYLWLNCFTDLSYNHVAAGFSAATSAVTFLLPALLIVSPIPQAFVLSPAAFDRLLTLSLLLGVATVAIGASYNFQFVTLENIYDYRDKVESPKILNYLIGMTSSALLPFAFAGFAARKAYWRAAAVLLLLSFFIQSRSAKSPYSLRSGWLSYCFFQSSSKRELRFCSCCWSPLLRDLC